MIETINPTTGELVATYEVTTPDAVAHHVRRATEEQSRWEEVPLDERAAILRRAAELLEDREEHLARLMAIEMGKPIGQGVAEVRKSAFGCRHYADEGPRILADQPIEADRPRSYLAWRPLGVVLAIMPWNFPLWQVLRMAAPTLMAGNAALLKHASNVTGCALAIDELWADAGLPDGLFRTLVLPSSRVADVIADPGVAAVTLTGSDPAGRAVAAQAGRLLKKTVLELGGSDPHVVLADADLDRTVAACGTSRLLNGGQSCISAKRFIVEAPIVEEFTERLAAHMAGALVGDPLDPETTMGPMARHDLRDELHDQVVRSVEAGAELRMGGEIPEGPGAFYPPTILTGVRSGMAAYHEETFGPVATVIAVEDIAEAVFVANDTDFGLGAAIYTENVALGEQIARERLHAGSCFVNDFVASDPRLPFGGIKMSGYGRELSDLGMREFLNAKTVVVA
jgi:succinate-semialdehyde dehydrogenase/glutarate-semialdehyde dehydrogenase